MFHITSNDIIQMTRGDSGSFTIDLNSYTSVNPDIIELDEEDKVYFGVMEPNAPFEKSLIKKSFTKDDLDRLGTLTIDIKPRDTELLLPGLYYYEIKVMKARKELDEFNLPVIILEDVYTVMPRKKFIIME